MTTNELEKFKQEASKLVEDLVNFYNETIFYSKNPDSQRAVRRVFHHGSALRKDIQKLVKLSRLIFKETCENKKEEKRKQRELKKAVVRRTMKENPNAHKPPKRTV